MCSWFCETFCCFLLPYQDSCIRNTSTIFRTQNRNADFDNHHDLEDGERIAELSAVRRASARGYGVEDVQPRPRPSLPVFASTWRQESEKPLAPLTPVFNGFTLTKGQDRYGFGAERHGSSSAFTGKQPMEESAADIGLFSPQHDRPASSTPNPLLLPPQSQERAPGPQLFSPPQFTTHQHTPSNHTELPTLPISRREHHSQEQPDLSHLLHPQSSTRHGVGDQSAVLHDILAEPSASDFAAATAMLEPPREFATGMRSDEYPTELDSDNACRAWQEQ